jgi:hypothetical protein
VRDVQFMAGMQLIFSDIIEGRLNIAHQFDKIPNNLATILTIICLL